ncbi:Cof-type HAD-IIB family hydrolase [Thermogutta sp.]|uniref:Cof-type HAD-IIB family hydrolase n=1 Tax=Thermogutta sp. TaxID=1962930 RepID=UPI003C7A7D45
MTAKFRLLAIDIDGTLVNSTDDVSDRTRRAIEAAVRAGMVVVLASGRRYSRVVPIARELGLSTPVVSSSGALIKETRNHTTLWRADFSPELLRRVAHALRRSGFPLALLGDTFTDGFDYYVDAQGPTNDYMVRYLDLNPGCHRFWNDFQNHVPPDVFAAFSLGTREEMEGLAAELHRTLPGLLTTNVLKSPRYEGFFCEMMPCGTTKWSAVCRVAAQWGIRPREICAVGDDVNDLAMISGAGLGIAMGNACEEVKAAAQWVAPSHEEDGLAYAITLILEGRVPQTA